MTTPTTSTARDFFSLTYAVGILRDTARIHKPQALHAASAALDTSPAALMRGTAYLGWLLAQVPEDERHHESANDALRALAEFNALVSELVELQDESDCIRLAEQGYPQAAE